jgi:nitronate monooxygenase
MAKSLPDTRLLDLFGIELPIVQAPMANSSGVDMAVAVAEVCGLGSFPCAGLSDDQVRDGMAAIRSRTQKPINLNFFCHEEPERNLAREAAWLERLAPYYKELGAEMPKLPLLPTIYRFTDATCAAVEELRPEVVSFHFGLPAPDLLARVKKSGCKIISSATTRREALFLAERGVDAIIAQGAEAGGHCGMFIETNVATQIGSFALVPQIATSADVPVIAAGGGDRRWARHGGDVHTRCGRRADRHGLFALSRGDGVRLAQGGARGARPPDRDHQCTARPPGTRNLDAFRTRAGADQPGHPGLSTRDACARPAQVEGRGARVGRFLAALVGAGAVPPRSMDSGALTRAIAEEALARFA